MELKILMPVYNDWVSAQELIAKLQVELCYVLNAPEIIIVNDGSEESPDLEKIKEIKLSIIHLNRNLGHQKAIAIGLAYIYEEAPHSSIVVMDADGEDRPEDIKNLIKHSEENPGKIIFARRIKRKEKIIFKLFYYFYKQLFRILTGKIVNFGNFSYVPAQCLHKLVYISEIWNNYPGGVIYSKIPYLTLPLERGNRYAGKSKMNMTSLIHHGLSAISALIEIVAVRVLIACTALIVFLILVICLVLSVRIFTDYASPGWATTIVFGSIILIVQAFVISLFFVFITLSNRSNKKFMPIKDYRDFVGSVHKSLFTI